MLNEINNPEVKNDPFDIPNTNVEVDLLNMEEVKQPPPQIKREKSAFEDAEEENKFDLGSEDKDGGLGLNNEFDQALNAAAQNL